MKQSIKKVFWKSASVQKHGAYYLVYLDNHILKTQGQSLLELPNRNIANIVVKEWAEQKVEIDYKLMLANRLVNAAIDKIKPNVHEVRKLLGEYAETDLLCYRSEQPKELIDKQVQSWDPFLDWIMVRYGVKLNITRGVIPISQPRKALDCLTAQMDNMSIFQLAVFNELVTISGSYILGLAVVENAMKYEDIWCAAILDESWQSSLWGEDDEHKKNLKLKKDAFYKAIEVYNSLS